MLSYTPNAYLERSLNLSEHIIPCVEPETSQAEVPGVSQAEVPGVSQAEVPAVQTIHVTCSRGNRIHTPVKHSESESDTMDDFTEGRRTPYEQNDNASDITSTASMFVNDTDNFANICNTFWRPYLTFHPYRHGHPSVVEFQSVWPDEALLQEIITEAFYATALRKAVLELCRMVLRCGPVRVLKLLIELKIIDIDQIFEDGSSMLHLACIARNFDAALYLTSSRIHKTRDKYGRTADQVCYCPKIKKLLPWARYMTTPTKDRPLKRPSMHERETMFELAKDSKHFDELQVKLQTLNFDINQECSSKGDFMVHIAAKEGLHQMPLLLSLVKIQNADIELMNSRGMTPLMIVADSGNAVLTDVLICILGANPSTPNQENGQCALHYAAANNHVDVVNCLLKRGADCNLEDKHGRRPDDLAPSDMSDTCEIIRAHREQRIAYLSELVQMGELFRHDVRVTDLYNVDKQGRTLIMTAATFDRCENLEILIEGEGCPIDAQHHKHGRTALAMATLGGHTETVELLLRNNADPTIKDMEGRLPIHHAVVQNNLDVVDKLLQNEKALTGLHLALKLSKSSAMHAKIKEAICRRQTGIVNPSLFECSITGNAGKLFCVLEEGDNVNPSTGGGDWPVYLAAENGHLEVIKLLHQHGGDICRQHSARLNTPLHVACSRGHVNIIKYLLQFTKHGAQAKNVRGPLRRHLDINAINCDRRTALQLAADKGYSRIVRLLLNYGATTAVLDSDFHLFSCPLYQGVQVLIETHRDQHLKLIQQAMKEKKGLAQLKRIWQVRFDHNLRDKSGDTPLMIACRGGKADVIRFMLESAVYEFEPRLNQDIDRHSDTSADSGTSDLTPIRQPNYSDHSDNDTLLASVPLPNDNTDDSSSDNKSSSHPFMQSYAGSTKVSQFSPANFLARKFRAVQLRKKLTHIAETSVCNGESDSQKGYHSDERRLSERESRNHPDSDHVNDSLEETDPRLSFDTMSCAVTSKEKKSRFSMFLNRSSSNASTDPPKIQYYQPGYSQSHRILSKPVKSAPTSPYGNQPTSTYADVPARNGEQRSVSTSGQSSLVNLGEGQLRRRSELDSLRLSSSNAKRKLDMNAGDNGLVPPRHNVENCMDKLNRAGSLVSLLASQGINHFVQGSRISHVCATNPVDGATPLHRTIEGGDVVAIVTLLLEADYTCVNIQNRQGLTPLHMAVKLRRKKIVEKLTALQYVDLNLRTLDGKLPDEMSPNKYLANLIKNSRDNQPQRRMSPIPSLGGSLEYTHEAASQGGGSSVDFDKLNTRFVLMKQDMRHPSTVPEGYYYS